MRNSFKIIDNFYDDFRAIRKIALNTPYEKIRKAGYSGRNSLKRFLLDGYTYQDTYSNGKFRLTSYRDNGIGGGIHTDYGGFSMVIYLNTPNQCQGGTTFWRHIPTGSTKKNPKITDAMMADWSQWEMVDFIEMKSNRCVIFDSNLYHSATSGFGSNKYNSRLIQIFFLKNN